MVAFSGSGEQMRGTQWYDNELDVVVKQEYQNDAIDELRNIKVGEVSKMKFSVPKGYTLFEPAENSAQQALQEQPKDIKTGEISGKN